MNKDKERRGKRKNACLWKEILARLNKFKDSKELWISKNRLFSQKEVECAERTVGDQIALNVLGSHWSPCFPPTSSELGHTSTTRSLCPHMWQHVLLLVSAFPFHPSHSSVKTKILPLCTEHCLIWPWLLLQPHFYHFTHCLKPTNVYPSAYSLHVQYSSSVHSCDSLLSFIHMSF